MRRLPIIRLELGFVLGLMIAAGGLFAFLSLADEISEGETHAFDTAILLALRRAGDPGQPIGPQWLTLSMTDVTALGGFTVLTLVTVLSVVYLVLDGKRAAAGLLAVSVAGGTLLSHVLKLAFDRPRPDLVAHLVDVRTLSFPSGHAMMSAVTFLTVGVLLARTSPRRRLKVYIAGVAVLLTLLVGFSRVFLGVHWPTDVLAGWSVGAAWAVLCWLVARMLQRRGQVEPAAQEPGDMPETAGDPGMEPAGYGGVRAMATPPPAEVAGTLSADRGRPRP
jgi:undecaprenyl-diphosphatase